MYNTKPCSYIYLPLCAWVLMVCATFVSVFLFENVYAAAVLSVFVARCLAFIFTQELKTRPYSPLHLSSVSTYPSSLLPTCRSCLKLVFFPVMLLKFSMLYATHSTQSKETYWLRVRVYAPKQRFREEQTGLSHRQNFWTRNMNIKYES